MKTVREYYSALDFNQYSGPEDVFDNLEVIGFGFFQERLSKRLVEWPYWTDLFIELIKVVAERADLPFRGGPTAARIMDAAKARYLTSKGGKLTGGKHGTWILPDSRYKIPEAWLRTITELGKLPEETE